MEFLKSLLALLTLCVLAASASAYVTRINVPAVLENQNIGNLTPVQLNVTSGNGAVLVQGPSSVDADTLASAHTAVGYAASSLGLKASNYNFVYTIEEKNITVSGPSGGLAFTLLAVAALQHRQLAPYFTATGTISSNGTVGPIGGVYDKVGAAKENGMQFILAPGGDNSSIEALIYYISQQTYGIPIKEVSNVSQALPYAFGSSKPSAFQFNLSQTYNLTSLSAANITCTDCNVSDFAELVNYTLNYSNNIISSIGSNFSGVKQSLLSNLEDYRMLAKKGYLYTAADLSFLDSRDAFTIAHAQNFSADSAAQLLDNISSYCSSLVPPSLTDQNYEYVLGGSFRQVLGNVTIAASEKLLSSEQTSDDIIDSVQSAATALGWCRTAYESYKIASEIGGKNVQVSSSLSSDAFTAISNARSYGDSIYLEAALQAYKSGDYATALYAATYANIFYPSASNNMTVPQLYSKALQNINNATNGTWPSQFAVQAEFYLRQSLTLQGANKKSDVEQAYTTSLLATDIASANNEISSFFTASNATVTATMPQQLFQEMDLIKQNVSQLYLLLLLTVLLLFAIFVILLVHIFAHRAEQSKKRRTKRR